MPRDGSNVYSKPVGTAAVSGQTIDSTKFNTLVDDIEADLNLPRPVVAGGTGATTPGAARGNLEVSAEFPTIASLAASATIRNGDYARVAVGYNGEPEIFKIDTASTLTADGAAVVTLTGVTGRAISQRKSWKTFAEMTADPRGYETFTAGDIVEAGGFRYDVATSGATDTDLTTAGGAMLRFVPDDAVFPLEAFGADMTGTADSTDAFKAAGAASFRNGGGTITWDGDVRISGTIDLREYCERRVVTAQNNYTEIMTNIVTPSTSRILWYGGQNGDGQYGTAIIALSSLISFGATVREGKGTYYTGKLRGFQVVAPSVPRGHAGGWPLTNRFTTVASTFAGCDLPLLATYPTTPLTKTLLPDAGLPVPNDKASCGIYAELLGGGVIEETYQEGLAFGAYIGIGYAFSFRNNTARWCNCGAMFSGAVTDFDVRTNCYERNAVGMLFATSSVGKIALNTVQANYAGADVVMHTNNHSLTFEQNYFEISPRCVVIRTDSTDDFRNSNIRFIRNHSLGLDVHVSAIDKMYLEENSIRLNNGVPDIDIAGGLTTPLGSEQIIVKDNVTPSEGNGGERRVLFTEWTGAWASRAIVSRDTLAPTERMTSDSVFGRITRREYKKELSAPVDVFKLTIPDEDTSGVIKVKVQKQRLGSLLSGEFEIMYKRTPSSVVYAGKTTTVSNVLTVEGTAQGLSVYGVYAISGGSTGENTLVIREFGADGSSSARVMVTADHRSLKGSAWITVVGT